MKTTVYGENALQLNRYEAPSIEVMGIAASGVICTSPFNDDFNDKGTVDWFE